MDVFSEWIDHCEAEDEEDKQARDRDDDDFDEFDEPRKRQRVD